MQHRVFWMPLVVSLIAAGAFPAAAVTTGLDGAEKFDEHLADALAAGGDSTVPVIVRTHGSPAAAADAARALGGAVTWEYTVIDGFAARVTPVALDALAARGDVRDVTLDRPVTTVMDVSHRAIEADKAWAAGFTGTGITVAVIDTGIDSLHPAFPSGTIVACVSTIGGLVSPECTDTDGHGTHVAGTVASRSTTYPGIAKGANLAAVRVLHAVGAGTSSDIIAGIDWVRVNQGNVNPPIRVATMSIGFVDPGCGDGTGPEAEAANNLVASGVVFTVAAGNSGHDSCTIDGASAAADVITIAAVDDRGTVTQSDDVIADFSSGGGGSNNLQKPDVSFPGVGITSAYLGGTYLTLDGTSMATPHAAGTAALVRQQNPSWTAQQVKDRIMSTAVHNEHSGTTWNTVYGDGLGNACQALGLTSCATATDPEPVVAHVQAIDLTYRHVQGGKGHEVTTVVTVVDAAGNPVSGATVSIRVTSPEGNAYSASGSTDSTGKATMPVKQRGGGHGTWQSCVTDVTGTNLSYDSASNVETCDTISVS